MEKYSKTIIIFLLGVLVFSNSVQGQSSIQEELSRRNLTLSEAQSMARQAGINPNNPDEIARVARANGVPEDQIQEWLIELRMRQNGGTSDSGIQDLRSLSSTTNVTVSDSISDDKPKSDPKTGPGGLEFFGYNIFGSVPDPFKPNYSGPVGNGYIVGPEDELRLSVWGATEFQYELKIDNEGRVNIPTIGQVMVAGQRLSELRESLKIRLSQSYSGLVKEPPTIFMDLTVTRLRPIQVFVLGEVNNPGGYTFSHNSSIFNVLYGVGGPKTSGSLRDIRIVRDGKIIASVDLYDLLLRGVELQNVPLLNNDRIFIPQRKNSIYLDGEVKRPAIYELNENEDLNDLLDFAGGLQPEAYGDRFQISRVVPMNMRTDPSFAREVLDYSLSSVLNNEIDIPLFDKDRIQIFDISGISDDIVTVKGLVNQPGIYELSENIQTVSDLILAADSLQDDAFTQRALLTRTKGDSTTEVYSVNIEEAMAGSPEHDIILEKRDELQIFRNTVQLVDNRYVIIDGEVNSPGRFRYSEKMTLEDLILKAGGFTEAAYVGDVEITRTTKPASRAEIAQKLVHEIVPEISNKDDFYSVDLFWPILDKASEFSLQHRDQVYIRSNPRFKEQRSITVLGQVEFPGTYTILKENERLSDLIERAGGITPEGYPDGARLKRKGQNVVIELDELLRGDKDADIFIQKNDTLTVPQIPNSVLVTGNIALDGFIKYRPNRKLTYYLDQAGGMQQDSYKYVQLIQANGATYQVKRKGLFKNDPIVEDGARINVVYEAPKSESEGRPASEVLQQSLAMLTSALTIIVLVDRAFN